jgi:hypothetical protein
MLRDQKLKTDKLCVPREDLPEPKRMRKTGII